MKIRLHGGFNRTADENRFECRYRPHEFVYRFKTGNTPAWRENMNAMRRRNNRVIQIGKR